MNIIITGAGKGIGFELTRLLTEEPGHTIIAISRNIQPLIRLEEEMKGRLIFSKLHPFSFNLVNGSYDDLKDFVTLYCDEIDVLVNNAGYLVAKPIDQAGTEDFDAIFNTNVKAVFQMVKTFLPSFSSGSHIVNIGSMGGFQGSAKFPGLALYSASKAAVAVLTECLAVELNDRNIKVNCLALGSAQTEMLAIAFPGYKAPLSAIEMSAFIKDFAIKGHQYFNGKVLPVSLTTP